MPGLSRRAFISLVAAYAGLIAYGSLFPFTGWQAGSEPAFAFLTHWLPSYSRADILRNVLAYAPLGLLVALAASSRTVTNRVALAVLAAAALSISMEMLQHWIPSRVASVFDVIANVCGSAAGALVAKGITLPPVRQWRMTWFKPGRLADVGLIVLATWALSQWSPLVPSLEISNLGQGVAPIWWTLRRPETINVMQAAAYAFSILGLALLARTLIMPGKPAFRLFFVFVALVLGYKIVVVGRQLSLEALIGASAAFVVALALVAQRPRVVVRFGMLFVLAGFVCAELTPGSDVARYPFSWVPFGGHRQHPLTGITTILEVLWPAGALAYLARTQGAANGWKGGAAIGLLAFALEWSQQWIPGRYGDLTTVLVMALAWAACFLACAAKRPDESVGAQPGVRKILSLALIAGIAVPLALFSASARASGTIHRVGPQHALKVPSAAARVAGDGDIVEIEAGTYPKDVAVWRQNGLIIRGVGGRAHLRADGSHAEGKAIWVIKGADTTIEHIEFSGAKVPDRNGAGIRLEGPGLTVRHCYFHHNENGILGGRLGSDLLIEHSEFAHNGFGDAQSHNLYVSARSFTLRYSYLHHAIVGHNVKSRALRNHIAYNRIMDERDGRSSYAIDLPDGGISAVIG